MKIKLSRSQWNFIGEKTGWIKKAEKDSNDYQYGKDNDDCVCGHSLSGHQQHTKKHECTVKDCDCSSFRKKK